MRATITVESIEKALPAARRGLMVLDITAAMTEMQMFYAIQSFRENVTGAVWARWMELFEEQDNFHKTGAPYPVTPE